jgi:signal transduction histidine kinase
LTVGIGAVASVQADSDYMQRFIVLPIRQMSELLTESALIGEQRAADGARREQWWKDVVDFAKHYRAEVQVAGSTLPDAIRQTDHMRQAGRLDLIPTEKQVVTTFLRRTEVPSVDKADINGVRWSLRALRSVNFEFLDVSRGAIAKDTRRAELYLLAIGLAAVIAALTFGLQVRRAIAPRIRRLVDEVRRFQELGVHQRIVTEGRDEIAVLANALDVGFAAIAERDHERDTFLSVAAHELKTPTTSIQGFAEAALAHPEQEGLEVRALKVIQRQAGRLARLVEDVLWAARARNRQLPFHPGPIDLAKLTWSTAGEVESTIPDHHFELDLPPTARALSDETLIGHTLWSLFTYATVLSAPDEPIKVHLQRTDGRMRLSVRVHGPPIPQEDVVRVFQPFSTIQYEHEAQPRTAVGLFLCREIARIHGGNLRVGDDPGAGPVLTLELPS